MGSPTGFSANLEFDELTLPVDRGSGAITPGVRLTNAATNLGAQTLTVQGSATTLNNAITTAQDMFSGGRVVTLQAQTTYVFEGQFFVSTGAVSHTDALSFVVSTALASMDYMVWTVTGVSGTVITAFGFALDVHTTAATVVDTGATTQVFRVFNVEGLLKTGNAVTTLKPQITFSNGPAG